MSNPGDRQFHHMIRSLLFPLLLITLASATTAADETKRPNVLLICIDDLRPELKCFGVDYIKSPNIDALAARGVSFHRHYVQAPTCGALKLSSVR